jgi:plastocyanin domain-containing protein
MNQAMKTNIIAIVVVAVLIGGAVMFTNRSSEQNPTPSPAGSNVTVVGGKQIVEINVKGGYLPKVTAAKANTPTTIRMKTEGTFDCSSAFTIPALSYRTNLPPTGVTEVEVPSQSTGTKLQGLCAMGMYSFTINFN